MKQIILLFTIFLFSVGLKAQTTLELYNNTGKDIYAAYAFYDVSNRCFVSKGWYKVERYSTTNIELGNYRAGVYIYGQQSTLLQDKSWGSGYSLCIEPNNTFEIRFADKANCRKKKEFSRMMVKPGINKWTFNP